MARTIFRHSGARPWTVRLICALVGLEALAVAVLGLRFGASLLTDHVVPGVGIVFGALLMLAAAVWLAAATRATWKGARWPRAAHLVTQVFLVVVGVSLSRGGAWEMGVLCIAVAGAILMALFNARTSVWMSGSVD